MQQNYLLLKLMYEDRLKWINDKLLFQSIGLAAYMVQDHDYQGDLVSALHCGYEPQTL